jgi:hypothetical protein
MLVIAHGLLFVLFSGTSAIKKRVKKWTATVFRDLFVVSGEKQMR